MRQRSLAGRVIVIGSLWLGLLVLPDFRANSAPLPQFNGVTVAWVNGGQVWVSVDGQAGQALDGENASLPALSPDRDYMAYVSAQVNAASGERMGAELHIVELASGERVLTFSSADLPAPLSQEYRFLDFGQPIWISDSAVIFNTLGLIEGPPGVENFYDIQRLSLDGTLTTLVEAGRAGQITLSPNREIMAVTRPGSYENPNDPAQIQLLDVETGAMVGDAFEYPSVSTGSELEWHPALRWKADSSTVAFAIPAPDLVYQFDIPEPSRACQWVVGVEPVCQSISVVYPAAVVWNDDLSRVAYVQMQDSGVWQLRYGEADSAGEANLMIQGNLNYGMPVLWLDDEQILYQSLAADTADLYLIAPELDAIQPWQPTGETVLNIQALGDGYYALATGTYAQIRVVIYHAASDTSVEVMPPGEGIVVFATR